jgi:tRNA(adenine34) deaminase
MSRALEFAADAARCGEVPVGALIVRGGEVLAEGHNRTMTDSDPSAHAEVVAMRNAGARIGDWRLTESTLYVTLEPCAMCCGAIVLARIPRVVYGASDPKSGMAGSLGNLLQNPALNHRAEVTSGVHADAAGALLREFFRDRRAE